MKPINSFKDLIVWQKSMSLVTEIYRISKQFPKEEINGLSSQIRRSAISIPSNIAEGYGRNSRNDYIRFLQISTGSIYELETQLEISFNLKYLNQDLFKNILDIVQEIERMLCSLIHNLQKK